MLFPIYCHYCTGEVVLRTAEIITATVFILTGLSCTEINPAGPGTHTNPAYPDSEKGYFFCGQDPAGCVFAPGTSTVWISDPASGRLFYRDVSMAIVNPLLVDTLHVGFSPEILVAPSSGHRMYASESGGRTVFMIDTEELSFEKVYISCSSVYTMELSSDGSVLFLGSQGAPWHVESVSTESFQQIAYHDTDWPVYRLEVSPDNSFAAVGNSGRKEILILDFDSLLPVDTLHMPMRTGTMAFLQNSSRLVVLDASGNSPYMIKADAETGEEISRFRPYNSYLVNSRIKGTNTLLLPRSQDERVSVLDMESMIFAPSLPLSHRVSSLCVSSDGNYIVAVSRTASPGRATVFHYEN